MANNYTLPRGEVHFARFKTGTQEPDGFRYIGNTTEFNITIENETLDHFSSDRGIREKDDSVPIEVTRTGTMVTDNIDFENLSLFVFGESNVVTVTGGSVTGETIEGVKKGYSYQLGQTAQNPVGARGIAAESVTVEDDTSPTPNEFTEGTDYTVDYETGVLTILEGGSIADETNLVIDYDVDASTFTQVLSGSQPVEGAIRYTAYNPKGAQIDWYFPWVSITPNGDFQLKGEEWQQIPFTLEFLKPTGKEAIYANGRPLISD